MQVHRIPMSRWLAAAVLALAWSASFAQEAPRADQRQDRQSARIAQGAASGALTGREQRRLNREQRAIQKAETNAQADGKVTSREKRRLEHMQDHASRDVYRQKHDRQRAHRPGAGASGPKP